MFAGKTTEMFRRIRRSTLAGIACTVVRYQNDKRYSNHLASSHDGATMTAILSGPLLMEAVRQIQMDNTGMVAIDEAQFYTDLPEAVRFLLDAKKYVILTALDGDFERRLFGRVHELIPLADAIEKLNGVCHICRNQDAPFSRRYGTTNKEQESIGAEEQYAAVCRACYDIPETDPRFLCGLHHHQRVTVPMLKMLNQ